MRAFLECMETVDTQLKATEGRYFLDYADHPTMIDFVFASHIKQMLASCFYWKGMDLRNPSEYPKLSAIWAWMDALEKHEYYLAFQSDYYTHIKNIPPQYGPGSNGVSRFSKIKANQANIEGCETAWKLPLEDDEALQPLYRGIPLPKCVLSASGITVDADGSYTSTGSTPAMKEACQAMAAWKICGNGPKIAVFAAGEGRRAPRTFERHSGPSLPIPTPTLMILSWNPSMPSTDWWRKPCSRGRPTPFSNEHASRPSKPLLVGTLRGWLPPLPISVIG